MAQLLLVRHGQASFGASDYDKLSDLGVDYLDLLLIHFPVGGRRALKECWLTMERLVDEGKCKAIGISNYYEDDVADLLSYARVKPACNQIELHPRLPQDALVEYCKQQGMVVTAYSPFGRGARGGMLDHAVVADIAKKHGVSASSVLLGCEPRTARTRLRNSSSESLPCMHTAPRETNANRDAIAWRRVLARVSMHDCTATV